MTTDPARRALLTASLGALTWLMFARAGAANGTRIAVKASKFSFTPSDLRATAGQPVTLMLSTEDFVHGFSLPDSSARIDLVPGKTVELTFTPTRVGKFIFLCDNFCGEGHDKMAGTLTVVAG